MRLAAALSISRTPARDVRRSPDWRGREGAWTSNATLHRLGWGWAPLIAARLERPERVSGCCSRACSNGRNPATRPPPRPVSVSPDEARSHARPADRARPRLARSAGDGRGGDPSVRAESAPRTSQCAARRGWYRHWQDARLSGAGVAVGEQAGGAVWVSTFTKALQRQLDAEGPIVRRPDGARAADRRPQGARELSLPAEPGRMPFRALRRPRRDPRPSGRPLGGLHQGRRHGRRRFAGLAAEPVPPRRRRPRSPTGAANASMPAVRTTGAASSKRPSARAARRTS